MGSMPCGDRHRDIVTARPYHRGKFARIIRAPVEVTEIIAKSAHNYDEVFMALATSSERVCLRLRRREKTADLSLWSSNRLDAPEI